MTMKDPKMDTAGPMEGGDQPWDYRMPEPGQQCWDYLYLFTDSDCMTEIDNHGLHMGHLHEVTIWGAHGQYFIENCDYGYFDLRQNFMKEDDWQMYADRPFESDMIMSTPKVGVFYDAGEGAHNQG